MLLPVVAFVGALGLGTVQAIKHEFKVFLSSFQGFNATGASAARAMMDTNGAATLVSRGFLVSFH